MIPLKKIFACVSLLLLPLLLSAQSQVLQLHPKNPHYFLFKGKPAVLIGSGEHYGAVINTAFDYKKYLKTLQSDGLNTTRLFTGAYVEKLGDFGIMKNNLAPEEKQLLLPWKRSTTSGYTLGGNKFDLKQWDEAYFVRLKDFMREAEATGIIVEITLFSAHYAGGWNYSVFNPKNNVNQTANVASALVNMLENGNILSYQEQYTRKIVRELKDFDNFYFEIQNEPWADQSDTVLVRDEYSYGKEWTSTLQVVSQRSNDWQRKVAQWIKDEEKKLGVNHLISQNISNFYYPITDPDPAVSIFNFHYAFPVAVSKNYHMNKVIGFNETGFAGRKDITYRRQAWRFFMEGGALFNHLDYSFSIGSEDGQDTTYKAPGGGSPALRTQFAILKHFFEKLDFVNLNPDHAVVTSAPGAMTQALSDGKKQWIVYVEPMTPKSYEITLNLPKGNYNVEWLDVTTGKVSKTGTLNAGKLKIPEGGMDSVALIQSANN